MIPASERGRLALLLVLFGALYYVDLGAAGVLDYDEAAYAEVARHMHLSGDWLNPVLNGEAFYEKPPLLYWSEALGYRVFGVGSLGARFSTASAALALLLAVYGFARTPLGPRAALLAAGVLGCSIEFTVLARIAFTDMLLCLWLFLSVAAFHRALEAWDERRGFAWLAAACVCSGLAMLAKGAIGLLLPAGAAFVFLCWRGELLRVLVRVTWIVPGLLLLLAVGLSWYLLLGLTHPDGFSFMTTLFVENHMGRFSAPMQGHGGPFFYYVPVLLVGFLPWSPFLWLALTRGQLSDASQERVRFLRLFGVFGALTFLFFSAAATKLPNYVAPVLPCLALLVANLLEREPVAHEDRSWTWTVRVAAGTSVGLGIAIAATPWVLELLPGWLGDKALKQPGLAEPIALGPWPFVASAALVVSGLAGFAMRGRRPVVALGGGFYAFLLVTMLALLPRYDGHFREPLRDLARQAAALVGPEQRVALVGIRHAPSVVFYGGRQTLYVTKKRRSAQFAALFQESAPRVGITLEAYFDRVRERGAEVIARRGGYVLFRCRPGQDSVEPGA